MWSERRFVKAFLFLLILLILWSVACSKEEKFIGAYQSLPNSPPGYPEVYLELKKGGEGIRRVREESVTFRWSVKGGEIRIYTRSGGIIVGKLQGKDILVVRLPGPKIAYLKKIK